MTDEELKALVASLAVAQAKTDTELNKLAATQAKTEEGLKSLAANVAAVQMEVAVAEARAVKEREALFAGIAALQAKTDAELNKLAVAQAKTDAQLAKTDAKIDKLAQMYGGVGNNQGKVAEAFYYNALKHKPILNGMRFNFIDKNVTRSKGKIEEEYDLLLVNGQDIFIVEVKYHVHPHDIERLIGRKADHFKKLFPEYAAYHHHLGLATFAIEDEVLQQALSQGVTVLQRRGKVFETRVAA